MKTLQGKIFLNNNELSNTEDNLIVFKEVPEVNYYSFLHEADMNGLVQVIIPSSVLISILKHFFKNKKARLVAIKLAEDEDDNIPIINQLISAVNNNRDYFIDLIEELNVLIEQDDMSVESIRLKYRENNKLVDLSISINGILDYSENSFELGVITEVSDYVWKEMKSWLL